MKKLKILLLSSLAIYVVGCDNYLDVNNDPNNVPYESVTPSRILPGAQLNAYRVQVGAMNELGNVFMNSWAGNVNSFTGGFAVEYQLVNIDNAFRNSTWNSTYLALKNFRDIEVFPNTSGEWDNYVASAKIMKAFYMQTLVDLYGNCPYSEAFLGQDNLTPKYDDDQRIYRSLIADLEDARTLIANASSTATAMGTTDIIFGGDMTKWEQFANTVELRMLIRMSNNTGAVAAYRDSKLATLSGASFISAPAMINPGFNSSTDAQLNPFYGSYLCDSAGNRLSNNQFICASNHIARFLNGSTAEMVTGSGKFYPGVIDARRGRMWRLSGGTVKGVTQGATSGTPEASNPVSALGWYSFIPYLNVPLPAFSTYAGTLPMASSSGVVMTLAEAEFLQAEAAVRWPSLFSGAQSHFNAGVTDAFAYYGLTPGTYLTTIDSKPGVGWTASTDKIECIMTQKWLATMHNNAIESFIDYNRTGYPYTPLAITAGQPRKPRRLIYPVSEYVANSDNVPSLTNADIFATTHPSHPFWMLGDPALGN